MKEKKEIGKLIELLNEYEKGKEKSEEAKDEVYKWELDSRGGIARYDTDDPREGYNLYSDVTPSYLTSKSFGFIKWLVENDKVKIPHELDELPAMYGYDYDSAECKADRLLMLLSISDTPIEDLISYLK